jgi:hypothetical protein
MVVATGAGSISTERTVLRRSVTAYFWLTTRSNDIRGSCHDCEPSSDRVSAVVENVAERAASGVRVPLVSGQS